MLRLLLSFGALLVAVFVVLRLVSLGGDLGDAPALHRPALLMPAALLYVGTLLAYAALWSELVCRLDHRRSPPLDGIAVFCASWLGRYVPSSAPYLAGKFALGAQLGHRKAALAASMFHEHVIVASVAAISSCVVLSVTLMSVKNGVVYLLAGLGGMTALAVLIPPVLHRLVAVAARLARRPVIASDVVLSGRGIIVAVALALLASFFNGLGFALVVSAFTDLSARELVASAAIFNLAGAAGVAALPMPSGLGVREAVLIGLLQLFVPIEVAAAAAVVMRLGGLGIDVLLGLAGAAMLTLRQGRLRDQGASGATVSGQPAPEYERRAA